MKIVTLLATPLAYAALALALPVAAFAATYQYVGTSGTIESVNADSPDQAFALATDIAPHSGVILDTSVPLMTVPLNTTTTTVTPMTPSTVITVPPMMPATTSSGSISTNPVGTYIGWMSPSLTPVGSMYSPSTMVSSTTASSTDDTLTLVLNADGTATLTTDYPVAGMYATNQSPMVESGTWTTVTTNGTSNQIQLTLNGSGTQNYSPAHVITFSESGDMLTATSYPTGLYPGGLTLTMQGSNTY